MRAYDLEVTGSLKVQGDIKAENYIVETTVTSMTQSFASGSSKFGDGVLDSHQFTGSLLVTGSNLTIDSVGTVSGSSTSTGSFSRVTTNKITKANPYPRDVIEFGNYSRTYINKNDNSINAGLSIYNPNSAVNDAGLSVYQGDGDTAAIVTAGNNASISGSATSTGSFGAVHVGESAVPGGISDSVPIGLSVVNYEQSKIRIARKGNVGNYLDITGGSSGGVYNSNTSGTQAHIFKLANTEIVRFDSSGVSGSSSSTGSFGRLEAGTISSSKYIGQIGSRFVHSQTVGSSTWAINHNIGHKYPVVTVYDDDDRMILPEQGTATDSNTFTLTFNEAITGKAVVSVGGIGENAGANFIHTQDGTSTNWRVTHSLSQQYPNITVFDENNEVILPETITATSANETDIVFSSPQSGYANFSIGSGIPNISEANAGKYLKVRSDGTGVEWVPSTSNLTGSLSISGSIIPNAHNHHDLGSDAIRWRNIYSADLQLSNEGTQGNEVDGTTGNWTIQEGEDDLYLLNRKNGKKYKFKLEEIT